MMRAALFPLVLFLLAASSLAQGEEDALPERRFCAKQILMLWKGHPLAPASVTKDKSAVREEALALVKRLRANELGFADAARDFSQCPSRFDGGYLGQFSANEYHPLFIAALERARYNATIGPLETPVGYVIFQRLPIEKPWPEQLNLKHILISYKGAFAAPAKIERSREEAQKEVSNVLARIETNRLSFAEAAKKYSDDKRSAALGGELGTRPPARFVCPSFVDRVLAQSIGELHGPIETPFGFHLVVRLEVEMPMRAAHILIPFAGASQAGDTKRTEAEAEKLAGELKLQLPTAGEGQKLDLVKLVDAFAELAEKHSSCPTAKSGGDLGEFRTGSWVAEFEDAVRHAKVGEVVGPVRTRFGYHLILRTQ